MFLLPAITVLKKRNKFRIHLKNIQLYILINDYRIWGVCQVFCVSFKKKIYGDLRNAVKVSISALIAFSNPIYWNMMYVNSRACEKISVNTRMNGHISIELFTLENYTKIAITDSGIGIKESEIPKLFQRFYRSPSVKNFPGVGVGLHLAQDIISRQYGFIHVLSTLHVGSTFEVWLINSDSPK